MSNIIHKDANGDPLKVGWMYSNGSYPAICVNIGVHKPKHVLIMLTNGRYALRNVIDSDAYKGGKMLPILDMTAFLIKLEAKIYDEVCGVDIC